MWITSVEWRFLPTANRKNLFINKTNLGFWCFYQMDYLTRFGPRVDGLEVGGLAHYLQGQPNIPPAPAPSHITDGTASLIGHSNNLSISRQ